MNVTEQDRADGLDEESLARAEEALAKLSADFLTWANADLASLRLALDEATNHPEYVPDQWRRLYAIAHDMKGQATTFDFPLITNIAARICRLIQAAPTPTHEDMECVGQWLDGIEDVITDRLSGDGGRKGRSILDRLP